MTVATSLVKKLPLASGFYGKTFVNSFYKSKSVCSETFDIRPVSEDSVGQCLFSLSVSKATGLHLIPTLRDSAGVISSILTHIANLSIRQGVLPIEMKNSGPSF